MVSTVGFWNSTNKPIPGDYHDLEIIDKIERILRWVSDNEISLCNYAMLQEHYGVNVIPDIPVSTKQFCGYSYCRICGKLDNGDSDIILTSDGEKIIFPDGYLHYIKVHGVRPSGKFEKLVRNFDLSVLMIVNFRKFDDMTFITNIRKIYSSMNSLRYSS